MYIIERAMLCCYREEWDWVKKLSLNEVGEVPTAAQLNFVSSLTSACRTLLAELGELFTPYYITAYTQQD